MYGYELFCLYDPVQETAQKIQEEVTACIQAILLLPLLRHFHLQA